MNALKKSWIWLCRFRKRKGYGVHSPFAYNFIRTVINEKEAYYAYTDLKPQRKNVRSLSAEKIDKLLFRLANFAQPAVALMVGKVGALSANYIQAGCMRTEVWTLSDAGVWDRLKVLKEQNDGMLVYLGETEQFREVFEQLLPFLTSSSVVVVDAPYGSDERITWWFSLEADERVGLTFDLYEQGIVLFDSGYSKQHYKVNFF